MHVSEYVDSVLHERKTVKSLLNSYLLRNLYIITIFGTDVMGNTYK